MPGLPPEAEPEPTPANGFGGDVERPDEGPDPPVTPGVPLFALEPDGELLLPGAFVLALVLVPDDIDEELFPVALLDDEDCGGALEVPADEPDLDCEVLPLPVVPPGAVGPLDELPLALGADAPPLGPPIPPAAPPPPPPPAA